MRCCGSSGGGSSTDGALLLMICPLCDTVNEEVADACAQCQMPLLVRECPRCSALFGKAADRCPKCGAQAPSVSGHDQPTADPPTVVRLGAPAAAERRRPAISGEERQLVQLQRRIERLESELAASRPAPLTAPAPAAPTPPDHDAAAPAQRKKALSPVLAGLIVVAAAGALGYQFREPLRRQLQSLPENAPERPGRLAVAADSEPLRSPSASTAGAMAEVEEAAPAPPMHAAAAASAGTAPTAAAAAVAEAEQLASALAAQPEPAERAGGEPPQVVFSPDDSNAPDGEAAALPAASDVEQPDTAVLPGTAGLAAGRQVMSAQAEVQSLTPEQAAAPTAAASPAPVREPVPVPITAQEQPAPRSAGAYDCRDAAISALGLCGATR